MRLRRTTTYAEAFSMDAPPPEKARTEHDAALNMKNTLRVFTHMFEYIGNRAARKGKLSEELQAAYEKALSSLNAMVQAKTFQTDVRREDQPNDFRLKVKQRANLKRGQARLLKEVVPAFTSITDYLKERDLQPHDDFLYIKERVDELVQALECVLKTSGKSR